MRHLSVLGPCRTNGLRQKAPCTWAMLAALLYTVAVLLAPAADCQASRSTETQAGHPWGQNPNGVWELWVLDDTDDDTGKITGGWSLEITAEVDA